MDINESKMDAISDKEFKRMITRMINKIKGDTHKYLNEFQENTNKQINEIEKTMQDKEKEFNKDIEIPPKIKLKPWK
jgi:gas vesicle protein